MPPRPEQAADPGANPDIDYPRPGFNCDAVELRPLRGTTEDEGPGLIWVRLRHPVVEGEHTSPTLAMMTLADFGIAVGWQRSPSGAGVINLSSSNPAADVQGIGAFIEQKHWGCRGSLVIDARGKPHHAPPLLEDAEVTRRVDALAARGGPLAGIL